MTITEALKHSQPIIAVWDENRPVDAWLGIYALPQGAAPVLLAHEKMPANERDRWTSELRGKGVRVGSRAGQGPALWMDDKDVFKVWPASGNPIEATSDAIRVADRAIAVADVAKVASFAVESRCRRGVRLELRTGSSFVLVEEYDDTPLLEPTYGRDMLLFDAYWASLLGHQLATFLGVEHVDEI